MKPLRDKLQAKWRDEFVQPVERRLGLNLPQLLDCAQGQVTFALLPDAQKTLSLQNWLLLADTREGAPVVRSNLLALKKQWQDAGKTLRVRELRGAEFFIVPVSTNDLPRALLEMLPRQLPYRELGKEPPPPVLERDLVVGMKDSALILSGSLSAAEAVVNALDRVDVPRLAGQVSYSGVPPALFRGAALSGWMNVKALMDGMLREAASETPNPQAPAPVEDIPISQAMTALGLKGVKSLAFSMRAGPEGSFIEAFVSAPEPARTGLVRVMAGEPKETAPPPFVPADVASFSRRRIDGQKAWAAFEKTLREISPSALNVLNFVLDTANVSAQEKIPGFDVRKNLIGNLGDDLITFTKAPADAAAGKSGDSPVLALISSPNAEELAMSLKSVLVFITTQAGPPAEREFLGRKIYTVQIPSLGTFINPGAANPGPQRLHYAASGAYVAFSFSQEAVEEYLRGSQTRALREIPGWAEAVQKVASPGASSLGYENNLLQTREEYEAWRTGGGTNSLTPGWLPLPQLIRPGALAGLLEPARLPPFDRVSNYFNLTVSSITASQEGLSYKRFTPAPPAARK